MYKARSHAEIDKKFLIKTFFNNLFCSRWIIIYSITLTFSTCRKPENMTHPVVSPEPLPFCCRGCHLADRDNDGICQKEKNGKLERRGRASCLSRIPSAFVFSIALRNHYEVARIYDYCHSVIGLRLPGTDSWSETRCGGFWERRWKLWSLFIEKGKNFNLYVFHAIKFAQWAARQNFV